MIDSWAGVIAEHIRFWWRRFVVGVGGEYDVPSFIDLMQLWSPQAVRVRFAFWWIENELGRSIVPITAFGKSSHVAADEV